MPLDELNGADTFDIIETAIDAVIETVNKTETTTPGAVLRQVSATEFDYAMTTEFGYKCAATSSSFAVTSNFTSRAFTVPANMQYSVGNRVRALGSSGNWIEGVVTAYSSTTLTVSIDRISGTGSFTAWTIDLADGSAETFTQTQTAGTTASASGVTIGTETYWFTYRVINKLMYLSFKAQLVITTGATVSEILLPLPTGITKDTTGNSSGYIWHGHASYLSSSVSYSIPCLLESYKDGTEGQRIKLTRLSEASATITIGNGTTSTIKGEIIIPIQ